MLKKSDGSTASYYELPKLATELQHLISHKDMNGQIAEIFRACYRYGEVDHSDKLRDAKKIKFYAQAEIERLEAAETVTQLQDSETLKSKPGGFSSLQELADAQNTFRIHNDNRSSGEGSCFCRNCQSYRIGVQNA